MATKQRIPAAAASNACMMRDERWNAKRPGV
jgi:hypothetical protein